MTEKQYRVSCERIEELLQTVGNETSANDRNFIELDFLSDLVADYEEKYLPVESPNLEEVIRLRMYELGITQSKLAEILEVSPSRVSEYLNGRSEPTLKVARTISKKLNIDASVVLGI